LLVDSNVPKPSKSAFNELHIANGILIVFPGLITALAAIKLPECNVPLYPYSHKGVDYILSPHRRLSVSSDPHPFAIQ